MTTPSTTPPIRKRISRRPQPEMPRRMNIDDATIRPKKNAHVWIGKSLSKVCITVARDMTLTPIPTTSDRRNPPLISFQNSLNLPLKNSFTASALIAASDATNLSYIPIMKAMVPPDTPGITSAAPIHAPLTAVNIYSENLPIYYLTFSRNSVIPANILRTSERRSSVGLPDITIS